MKLQKNKGITLIALIITIIVLFILAVISVATLTGENGLLNKANIAKEESKKAEYKEELELIGQELQIEQKTENFDTREYMDRYEKEIKKDNRFKEPKRINNETIIVTTQKEGYVYEITQEAVEFIGKTGETAPPDLKQSDIEGICDPDDWTNGKVQVTLNINNTDLSNYGLQYSLDGKTNWKTYTEPIIFKDNGSLFVRLQNELLEFGGATTINVANIDKLAPKNATIKLSTTSLGIGQSVQVTVTHTDEQADSKNAQSGINISKCKWEYNTTSEYIGTDESSYKGTFSNNDQILSREFTTIGTYYLHVLTTDNAGNKNETISEAIKVTGNLSSQVNVGDYVNYKAGTTHSYTSKKGTGTTGGTGYATPQTFTSNDNIKWRVLSKENNEIVLISEEPISTTDNKSLRLNNAIGYLYAEEELNKICSIYGHGVGANTSKTFSYEVGDVVEGVEKRTLSGSGARSITVEDVNKICGVTPSTTLDSEYGKEYTISISYPTRKIAIGYSTSVASRKYKNTSYSYKGSDKISTTSNEYKILFRNAADTFNISYWLASRSVSANRVDVYSFCYFEVCDVLSGDVNNLYCCQGTSAGFFESCSYYDIGWAVRPVVYLKSNIQTSGKDSSGAWTIIE